MEVVLQQVFTGTFNSHGFRGAFYLQGDVDVHWDNGSNLNVLRVRSEASPVDRDMIGIEWNVRDAEFSRTVRTGGSLKTADRVANFYGCVRNNRARWINYRARDRSRASTRLRTGARDKEIKKE